MNFEILKTDGSQIQVEPPKDKMTLVIVKDNDGAINEELFKPDSVVLKDLKNLKIRFEPDFQFNGKSVNLLEFKYTEKENV